MWSELDLLAFVFHVQPSEVKPYLNIWIVCRLTWHIVASIANCAALKYIEGIFFEISVPATSLLFLFRVKAVYNHSRIVTAFFGFLWLAIATMSILIMLGITGGERIYYGLEFHGATIAWQIGYRTRGAAPKVWHTLTLRSQSFWPFWMIPSSSLLFLIVWSRSPWWVAAGVLEPNHSSGGMVFTTYRRLCYKADKLTICQLLACNPVWLRSNVCAFC